jgi:hypothetical protein
MYMKVIGRILADFGIDSSKLSGTISAEAAKKGAVII